MIDVFAVSEESDGAELQDGCFCCSAARTLRYSQDLHAKNITRQVSWKMAVQSLEVFFFSSSSMTHMGIAV